MDLQTLEYQSFIVFTYTNWKGETSERKAIFKDLVFGCNEWHKEEQLMLLAYDVDKMDLRTFAAKDITNLKVVSF